MKGNFRKIVIEVSANRYRKEVFPIENLDKKTSYVHHFVLQKDSVVELKEVIVTAKSPPFVIKEDTVKFNVAAYRDGSERKIEDVIKKLPGVEVNDKTGEITYKGKSIETVKLEGDDLFGLNYSIGTKNINVDMVEQVQAIENYSANPLLKGIEGGEKVALNLKLKKSKFDFSGNIDLGNGITEGSKSVFNSAFNILGISKKYKSFGTLSFNNVGVNNSPFDYFSSTPSVEQIKETDFLAKKIIPETIYASSLDEKRTNINKALFGSYNSVFKIGKHISVKSNLYYLHDNISSNQVFDNNNLISNQQILSSDRYDSRKVPQQYRSDFEIKSSFTERSLLEYKLTISRENLNTSTNILQNNSKKYQAILRTNDFDFKQSLLFTQRLSDKEAFQVLLTQSSNNIPQNYFLSPSLMDSLVYFVDNQQSNDKKDIVDLKSTLLGRIGKSKYTFSVGSNIEKSNFQSNLMNNDNADKLKNDFTYKKYSLNNKVSFEFNLGNFKVLPSYTLSYMQQELTNDFKNSSKNIVIFEPSFSLKYRFSSSSGILFRSNYIQKPFSEEYFFDRPIYVSNRMTIKNIPTLALQKTSLVGLIYLINNLYEQFRLNLGISYSKSEGNYLPNIFINENITQMEYFYSPKSNQNINFNFLIEKYFPILQSTVRLKSNYAIASYYNIVNNSDLRQNESHLLSSELFIKTAFDTKINFENIFTFGQTTSKSTNSQKNRNSSFNNSSKVIIKPNKQWFFITNVDYFLPNMNNTTESLFFWDTALRYSPKTKNIEFSLAGKNITNNKYFTQLSTSDFSINSFKTNLISRYFILNVTYSF
ncbi:hypothetical protein VB776_21195 [Arcicella sp. DC2W]|uniref:TonB-dependent receptor n=1 Tax=Arcicella gelida TaxID=2984195 RepID=A0ABU5SAM2_9BACT|nr:hypothetical protein [Arcicella sp. DC2W]MEA5405469.1 hypothetical protein [Arcicella sp. DC2W]